MSRGTGRVLEIFHNFVAEHANEIIAGTLVVDPSSGSKDSMPGYAVIKRGEICANGVIKLNPKQPVQERLRELHAAVKLLVAEHNVTVLAVERIRGRMAHVYLTWACGTVVAAGGQKIQHVVEVPIPVWKRYAREMWDYTKGDAADAKIMAVTLLRGAKYVLTGDPNLLPSNARPARTASKRTNKAGTSVVKRRRSRSKDASGRGKATRSRDSGGVA